MSARAVGRLYVVIAALSWGTSATLARSVFRDAGVPPLQVVELRVAIATLALLLWTLFRDRTLWRIERRDIGYMAALGLLGVTLVKLFFHDLDRLDSLYRIGALAGVAVVAMTASFLYQKFFSVTDSDDAGTGSMYYLLRFRG